MSVLEARGLTSGYQRHPVVHDIDISVGEGQVVALLGPNGAGKTTTLLTLAGVVTPLGGELRIDGKPTRAPVHRRAMQGMGLVTEQRSVFMDLTAAENLRVGRCDVRFALELFPELEALQGRRAGLLSGGEQQMLTLARALARRPRLLLVDELSLGLAPLLVRRLLVAVRTAADEQGVGVVLVEQHASQALRIADHVHVLQRGRIVLHVTPEEVGSQLSDIYLSSGRGSSTNRERTRGAVDVSMQ
jgi:branched-chain amino acid transport system ATP-binding protein